MPVSTSLVEQIVAHPLAKSCKSGTFRYHPAGDEGLAEVVETGTHPPGNDKSVVEALASLEALSKQVRDEQVKLLSTVEDSVLTPLRSLSTSDLLSIQERMARLQQYADRYEKAMHRLLPSVVEYEINHIVQVNC